MALSVLPEADSVSAFAEQNHFEVWAHHMSIAASGLCSMRNIVTIQDVLGCNMFAYCGNNPVMRSDMTGTMFLGFLVCVGISAAIGGLCGYISDRSLEGALSGAVQGAATTALCLTVPEIAVEVMIGSVLLTEVDVYDRGGGFWDYLISGSSTLLTFAGYSGGISHVENQFINTEIELVTSLAQISIDKGFDAYSPIGQSVLSSQTQGNSERYARTKPSGLRCTTENCVDMRF